MNRFDYLIVGNSAAAMGAVEAIRNEDANGSIAIVCDEPHHVYSRPRISECITGKASAESIAYRPLDFYQNMQVTTILGKLATSVETEKKSLSLQGGAKIEYGKLLLSTGARPARPPIPGIDLQGVHFFTTFAEAEGLACDLADVRQVVVIGAGLIGLQAAEALGSVGIEVTVVEMLDRPLALSVDEYASSLIQELFEENGITLRTSRRVSEILSDKNGRVSRISLDDGSRLDCQAVVMAAGVTPRTELAQSADIKINKGILVDDQMLTSVSDIYAAGDVVEAYDLLAGEHRLIPIWPNAYMEGRTAGLAMAGKPSLYRGEIAMNAAHFFGFPVISAGITDPNDDCRELVEADPAAGYYRKIILRENVPVGMVLAGDAVDRSGLILSLIKNQTDASPFADKLASTGFSTAHLPDDLREIKQLGREQI